MLFHRLSPSALRHHAEGIFFAERIFGVAIVNGEGKQVRLCCIGGQHVKHVKEDLGYSHGTRLDVASQTGTLDVWSAS